MNNVLYFHRGQKFRIVISRNQRLLHFGVMMSSFLANIYLLWSLLDAMTLNGNKKNQNDKYAISHIQLSVSNEVLFTYKFFKCRWIMGQFCCTDETKRMALTWTLKQLNYLRSHLIRISFRQAVDLFTADAILWYFVFMCTPVMNAFLSFL